jgi:choline dehydrogenase-like flavoprotein
LEGGANRVAVSMLEIGISPWQICRSGVSRLEWLFQKKVTSAALFRAGGKSGCSHRHPMPGWSWKFCPTPGDEMSVVDRELRVYGLENLRIADASIMPRVTTGNTMAPCVVIGEHAAEMLKIAHRI